MNQRANRIAQAIKLHNEYNIIRQEYENEGLPFDTHLQSVMVDLLDGGSFSGQSIATCVVLIIQILRDLLKEHIENRKRRISLS